MLERLGPLEIAFLTGETASTPMHVATLDIFEPPASGFDYERLVALIADRIAFVPRYRQRVRLIPGRIANPLWIDDEHFDLSFHVRRSALPRPGSMIQLNDLVARIMSRRLDRSRPMWETYLIEGLADGRHAILAKSHQALVDGTTVDLAQLIVDDTPDATPTPEVAWTPERTRSDLELLAESLADAVHHPEMVVDDLRGQVSRVRRVADRALEVATGLTGRPSSSTGPLAAGLSQQRRFLTVDTKLADYRRVRRSHGGTVNDVILATITGAFRAWLMTRAESVSTTTSLRTLVPLSVVDDEFAEPTSLGTQVTSHLLSLPIGEPNPVIRLHQVSYALKAHRETGRAVAAGKLADTAGFAPTTFHALGARVAARHAPRSYQVLITNVPGPQFPLYAAGSRMVASYPVLPLAPGHALAIGVTSYDGSVCYGLHADRDAVGDIEVLGQCVREAVEELVDASSPSRPVAPRGRVSPSSPGT